MKVKSAREPEDQLTYQNLISIGIIVLILVVLTFFCKILHFSLSIPLFLIIIGLHLKITHKADSRLIINLGLLLTLIVTAVIFITQYTDIPFYYIPVASVAVLTMLLFNNYYLAFLMTITSGVVVSLILNSGFETFFIYFLGGRWGFPVDKSGF